MPNQFATGDQLLELCANRLMVLKSLRDLTIEQFDRVQSGDTEGLLTMLSHKQNLLDEVQRIQMELRPFQEQDPETRSWSSPEKRAECRFVVEQGQKILQELVSLEGSSIDWLSLQRDSVANELKLHHSATAVRSAYDSHERFEAEIYSSGLESNPLSLEG